MKYLVVLFALALNCSGSPVTQQDTVQRAPPSQLATLAYALDLSAPVSVSGFTCFRQNLYNVAFIRGYSPLGSGTVDPYACANIQNANNAGVGTEVYMTPQPNSAKSGAQQFDEMYNNLRNSNIQVRSVWIQVTSPINWYSSSTTNINFLNSILSRASQYGLTIGIYTNYYDWNQITGGATINNAMLWYWNVYGGGPSNETPANFNDFRSFGGWTVPSVKQFAQVESVCGITVNRDVYAVSSAMNAMTATTNSHKSEQLTVGGLGLESAASFTGKPEIKVSLDNSVSGNCLKVSAVLVPITKGKTVGMLDIKIKAGCERLGSSYRTLSALEDMMTLIRKTESGIKRSKNQSGQRSVWETRSDVTE